jgi:exodeoxyribonuclease VII large subunit
MGRGLERLAQRADGVMRRLARVHPGVVLRQHAQRLETLHGRLLRGAQQAVALRRLRAQHATARLRAATPATLLAGRRELLERQRLRLAAAARLCLAAGGNRLAVDVARLQALSPLRTLERGYAIVSDALTGTVIRSASEVEPGAVLHARLGQGSIEATVVKKLP